MSTLVQVGRGDVFERGHRGKSLRSKEPGSMKFQSVEVTITLTWVGGALIGSHADAV